MSADIDGQNSSNGFGKSLSNGSRTETGFPTAVSNGNGSLKAAGSQNGSSWEANRPRQQLERYHGHNREQFTRLIIQAITEMGYNDAAEKLSQDSGYRLENPMVAAFRAAVLDGDWGKAEELLNNAHFAGTTNPGLRDGLILASGADRNMMKLWLRQQKYLELLERRETPRALMVLRTELTPLCGDQHQKLEFLSSLLMCTSADDLKDKAEWDGARGESRHTLLSELSSKSCGMPALFGSSDRLTGFFSQNSFRLRLCSLSTGWRHFLIRHKKSKLATAYTIRPSKHPHFIRTTCATGILFLQSPSIRWMNTTGTKFGK